MTSVKSTKIRKFRICVLCHRKRRKSYFAYGSRLCRVCKKKAHGIDPCQADVQENVTEVQGTAGFLYAIRNPHTALVKIGFTKDVDKRMANYASHAGHYMQLLAAWTGTTQDEAAIIREMKQYKVLFDWHSPNPVFDDLVQAFADQRH